MVTLTNEYCFAVGKRLALNAIQDYTAGQIPEIEHFDFFQEMDEWAKAQWLAYRLMTQLDVLERHRHVDKELMFRIWEGASILFGKFFGMSLEQLIKIGETRRVYANVRTVSIADVPQTFHMLYGFVLQVLNDLDESETPRRIALNMRDMGSMQLNGYYDATVPIPWNPGECLIYGQLMTRHCEAANALVESPKPHLESVVNSEIDRLLAAVSGTNQKAARDSKCFVATAVFEGSENAPVQVLRRFRDLRLRPHWLGTHLVRLYSVVGPHLAKCVESRPWLRAHLRPFFVRAAWRLRQRGACVRECQTLKRSKGRGD